MIAPLAWPEPAQPYRFDGAPEAPAVLLLHGLSGSPFCMRPLARALHAAGHTVYAPRLPGHGETVEALAAVADGAWSRAAADAARELAEDHPRLILCGLSMGALLAIELATSAHPVGDALILLAPALLLPRSAQLKLTAYRALRRPERLRIVPKSTRRYRTEEDPAYRAYAMDALVLFDALRRRVRGRVELLHQPLLLAHGLLDESVPLEASFEIARRASSRLCRTTVLRRSQHILTLDLERERLAREVLAFLRDADA